MSRRKKSHAAREAPAPETFVEKVERLDATIGRKYSLPLVIVLMLTVPIVVAVGAWFFSGATGTVNICKSEEPDATSAIMLTVSDVHSRNRGVTTRSLVAFDVRTGKSGKSYDAGESGQCLGGLGGDVVLYTTQDGIHLRNVVTGAITKSERALLGDLEKTRDAWRYEAESHRLWVRTKFHDEIVLDLATHEQWPAEKAPAARAPHASAGFTRLEFESEFAARQGLARGFSYELACKGSRCKLATRAMNAYGNTIGVDPTIVPLATADEILVAQIVRFLPNDDGVLVSALERLDESSRELVRLGLDGKVKWRAKIAPANLDGYAADDVLVLGTLAPVQTLTPVRDRFYANHVVDAWLVGKDDGRVRATAQFKERDVITRDLADVIARFGGLVVIAAHGEAATFRLDGGAPLWRRRF